MIKPRTLGVAHLPFKIFPRGPIQPNEKLAVIVGAKPLPRTELVKKLRQYIKKKRATGQEGTDPN